MFRPSRSLTIWLLWLAIALLPVRAWAGVAMPVAMSGMAAATVQPEAQVAGAEPEHSAMPCHGTSDRVDDTAAPQACNLCAVCHAAFATLPSLQPLVSALSPERPAAAFAPAVEAAALAGPERPPRVLFA